MESTSFRKDMVDALRGFCRSLNIRPTQNPEQTIKQFVVLSAVPTEHVEAAYNEAADDFAGFRSRAKRGISLFTNPRSSPKRSNKFWSDLFDTADLSQVKDIGIYKNYKELMAAPLKNCTESQKALAYFLTVMKDKHGANIGSSLISQSVGDSIDNFQELDEADMAAGLGGMVAVMGFPFFESLAAEDLIGERGAKTVAQKRPKKTVKGEAAQLIHIEARAWSVAAKRAYGKSAVMNAYKETHGLRTSHAKKDAFKHVLATVGAKQKDWEQLGSEFGASTANSADNKAQKMSQNDLCEGLFGNEIESSDWMPFLALLDHCDVGALLDTQDAQDFVATCKTALPDSSFSTWSDRGAAKKFLTVYTPEWDKIWQQNWKINQGLRRGIAAYRKKHKHFSTETLEAIRKL